MKVIYHTLEHLGKAGGRWDLLADDLSFLGDGVELTDALFFGAGGYGIENSNLSIPRCHGPPAS